MADEISNKTAVRNKPKKSQTKRHYNE